jgi:plastocyanin
VYFGNVSAGGNVSQAARDINNVQHQHNAPDYYEHAKRFCALAVAAFLLSLAGLWPAALPVGYAARRRIRRTGEGGGGLTTAALVISWSTVIITVIAIAAMFAVASGFMAGGPGSPLVPHAAVREQRIRITEGPAWPEFLPRSTTLGPGSTVVWVNERDSRCRLVATNDELPDGTGANPIRQGGTYRITFTEPGMYGFACDGDLASGGTIIIR